MAEYTFADDQDWLSSHYGFRYLRVQFKGKAFNRADKLFLIFEDEDWGTRQTVVECSHSAVGHQTHVIPTAVDTVGY